MAALQGSGLRPHTTAHGSGAPCPAPMLNLHLLPTPTSALHTRPSASCNDTPTARLRSHVNPRRTAHHRPSVTTAAVTVPHAGYHFDGSSRRFFEGWYWKVTDEATGDSFALIYSVEDPGKPGATHAGVGIQVMGPDGYVCQFSPSTKTFWADRNTLALGATLRPKLTAVPRGMVSEAEFNRCVDQGFQASAVLQQGSIIADEAGAAGGTLSTQPSCSWNLKITPMTGWGAATSSSQRATAGWLSALQVFEPHWQVLMSHGLASGWVQWGDRRYEFTDAPSYAEKNWGGGFPSKWHWLQCNTWEGQPGLSVTAVGARRALLLGAEGVGLGEEDVGLIGITLPSGEFIELVPWTGELDWDVDPWGRWFIKGVGKEYEVVVEGRCEDAGVVLRAPTINQGLTPFCKDSFRGTARLRVWRRGSGPGGVAATPFVDATSTSAAVEVGGGPWWTSWAAKAAMKEPFRTLVQLPIDVGELSNLVPGPLKPPGL